MHVIRVPSSLDYSTVDSVFQQCAQVAEGKALFDAGYLRFVDPQGLVGLLSAGALLKRRLGQAPHLRLPRHTTVLGYLARIRFFEHARRFFSMQARRPREFAASSDVLLEITPVTTNSDVHTVVDRVQSRAGTILTRTLGYPLVTVVQFSVVLSEVCQNIIEHAEAPGWVAAQAYYWAKRRERWMLVIAVSDLGRGFRGSLAAEHAGGFGRRWGDGRALEAAFLHGVTRFQDSGRGQGIQQIRRQVRRWDGLISIRSGTARIADVPDWDDTPALEQGLARFPGAQINIVLPASERGKEKSRMTDPGPAS